MKVTPGSCPWCGVINRETETIVGRQGQPQEGDLMICDHCAKLSIYIGHGATRKPDDYEYACLLEDPLIMESVFLAELALL